MKTMAIPVNKVTLLIACVLFELPNPVSSCKSVALRDRLIGFGCAEDNQKTFTDVAEHECILHCVGDKSCTAVNYDAKDKMCTRLEYPCPVLGIYEHLTYQILAPAPIDGCAQWVVTNDWNYPRIVKKNEVPGAYSPVVVARIVANEEILPAKWPLYNTNAYTIQESSALVHGVFEVFVVNKACSLLWLSYDASSGDPLPPGAIPGGRLADGTPLYVAAVHVTGHGKYVLGYYNHLTRMGACYYSGVQEAQSVQMLTAP